MLRDELKLLLVRKLRLAHVPPESIGDDDVLLKGPLGLDSLDLLDLALAVEEAYGIKIGDEQLGQEAFRTLGSLAQFVERRRATG